MFATERDGFGHPEPAGDCRHNIADGRIFAVRIRQNAQVDGALTSAGLEVPSGLVASQDRLQGRSLPERDLTPRTSIGISRDNSEAFVNRSKSPIDVRTRAKTERICVALERGLEIRAQLIALNRLGQKIIFLDIQNIRMRDLGKRELEI